MLILLYSYFKETYEILWLFPELNLELRLVCVNAFWYWTCCIGNFVLENLESNKRKNGKL